MMMSCVDSMQEDNSYEFQSRFENELQKRRNNEDFIPNHDYMHIRPDNGLDSLKHELRLVSSSKEEGISFEDLYLIENAPIDKIRALYKEVMRLYNLYPEYPIAFKNSNSKYTRISSAVNNELMAHDHCLKTLRTKEAGDMPMIRVIFRKGDPGGKLALLSKCSNGSGQEVDGTTEKENRFKRLISAIALDSVDGCINVSQETYQDYYNEIQELVLPVKVLDDN